MFETNYLNTSSLSVLWPCLFWPFFLAMIFVSIFTPGIVKLAKRAGLLDPCNDRKVHSTPIPRLGGVVFIISAVLSFLMTSASDIFSDEFVYQIQSNILELFALYSATAIMFFIGFKDDLVGAKYSHKFVAQFISAGILVYMGLRINSLQGIVGIYELSPLFSIPLSLIIIVLIINSINLIDGIDGLAASICIIALISYTYIFLKSGNIVYASICLCICGSVIPYIYFNITGGKDKKNKLFMGDSGSLSLGILMAFMSLKILNLPISNNIATNENTIILAFTPLIVPCFDLVRVFGYRISKHKSPFTPDKNHIHHKLLKVGLNQHQALICIILFTILCMCINISLSSLIDINFLVLLDVILWMIPNLMLTRFINKIVKEDG
ncbi:glycosyltransferase family 4 protein [Falsiporphyromonas endometrii]|uniref:Glycosyltransferase family 4 protein n=1 Tax=Falsiporphyromonas endometrii TaxID=1387297 RepID=A0ABV9K8J1_9PORP